MIVVGLAWYFALVGALGALYGVIAGAFTEVALVVLRSYALGARWRARTVGFVMSATPWVLAARFEGFPIYLLGSVLSGGAGGFLAPWALHGMRRRAPSELWLTPGKS